MELYTLILRPHGYKVLCVLDRETNWNLEKETHCENPYFEIN